MRSDKTVDTVIRAAEPDDVETILDFIRALARYEDAEDEVVATPATLRRSLFGDPAHGHGLIAERGGPVGFAVYFFNYSTWQARPGLYLEDIFVVPQARGLGVGKAMMRHLARIALEQGCGRFEWSVLDWNTPAIRVYESIGARPQKEWIRYRLADAALEAFAAGRGDRPGDV